MKIKNIINLSKLFITENIKHPELIKRKDNQESSNSFWMIIILFISIILVSNKLIEYFVRIGKPEIFLNVYSLFLQILFIMQAIMLCMNVLYFSKQTEKILPLPFKPMEILISKFNTIMFSIYGLETFLGLIPLIIYGINVNAKFSFFVNLIICLIIFPLFFTLIISLIVMALFEIIKKIKNRELANVIISSILIVIFLCTVIFLFNSVFNKFDFGDSTIEQQQKLTNINEKIKDINKYFIVINPITNILINENILINYFILLILNTILAICFFGIGNKLYLKQIVKVNFYKDNNKKGIDLNKKVKKKNRIITYMKKEFKLLKNPILLMQTVYPAILATSIIVSIMMIFIPAMREVLKLEEYEKLFKDLNFDFEAFCIILGMTQFVGLLNFSSITSYSREGKNAFLIKTIPISLFKQFILKNIPQIFLNTICSAFIIGIIKYEIPEIEMQYIVYLFVLSILLHIINSFILSIIDLLNPKINWDTEYEITKNNKNKLLQYGLIIFNIIFLYYFNKLLIGKNLKFSIIILGLILIIILIFLNLVLNKNKNKIFKKIF